MTDGSARAMGPTFTCAKLLSLSEDVREMVREACPCCCGLGANCMVEIMQGCSAPLLRDGDDGEGGNGPSSTGGRSH
ncbi:hypothetical protein SAMN05216241_101266 [Limimonas halophila]|uniref:Uncharacterized protein n=1 Tax=Limimonas halophila TaxID=1082479 RepID=A0A1G7LIP8_9PROT|nr:hypothetical protein SAMN05216241_101266 [Limimonas halophila]